MLGPWALADVSRVSAVCGCAPQRPVSSVRLNPLGKPIDPSSLPFVGEPIRWGPRGAFLVTPGARPGGHVLYGTGAYYIQEPSSLLAVTLLDPRPGEIICDLCAAPGGKSTGILEALGGEGFLVANEAVRSRLPSLRLNLARHGGWRYTVTNLDPSRLAARLVGVFDAVLVDAPCSGQSMVSRGKQSTSAFAGRLVRLNAARQKRILEAAASLLKPGGRLVYSTCTYSWDENEQQVLDLLDAVPCMWHPDPLEVAAPYACGGPAPPACYRLWPDRHGCAGAFAARLRYEPGEGVTRSGRPDPGRTGRGSSFDVRQVSFAEWGRWSGSVSLTADRQRCWALADTAPDWAATVGHCPEVAFKKGRTWFPAYALAMRRDGAFVPARTLDLNCDLAAEYLAGHPCPCDTSGWVLCALAGKALGWGKSHAGILNNRLPVPARLTIGPAREQSGE